MEAIQFRELGKRGPAARAPATAPRPLLRRAVYDGYDFALFLNYFDGLSAVMKAFQGRYTSQKDSPLHRSWRLKKQVVDQQGDDLLRALMAGIPEAEKSGFRETQESFSGKVEAARIAPQPSAFVGDLKESLYPLQFGGVALIGSYHPGVVALVKNMGGRYLPSMKAWKLFNTTPIILKNNLITTLSLRDEQVEIQNGVYSIVEDANFQAVHEDDVHIRTENNALPEDAETAASDDEPGDNDVYLAVTAPLKPTELTRAQVEAVLPRYGLYDFQPDGVWHLVSKTSALLADDMGLGKSRQAAVAADVLMMLLAEAMGYKLLIVCPASLLINWTREIAMIDPGAAVSTQGWDESAKWIVTNYERLEELVPHAHRFLVMITDEAHLLKEPTNKRTRLAFDIAAKVPYRFILTGTPILNRECEIHTLLRLSGHPIGNVPLRRFEEEFAGDAAFRQQLNRRIAEWMLRRTKDRVLKSLKGKQRQLHYVEPVDLRRKAYEKIANDSSLLPLPKITRLRQTLEAIKVDAVLEMISEMQSDDKVLVFCEFKETVALLKSLLAERGVQSVTMIGTDTPRRRQKAVDAFQDDPDVRVFVGTTRAAGVGYNLTAANYVLFASLPWTPALKEQAEDRAYRNGQTRLVIVKIPLMENTIDMDLWELLKHKHEIATDILDPEAAEDAAMEEFAMKLAA